MTAIKHVRWANGSITYKNFNVGPKHDPYSRDIAELTINGRHFTLGACGLAGEYIEDDDTGEHYELEEPWNDPDGKLAAREDFEAAVEALTGYRADFWWNKLPEKVLKARYRNIPDYWMIEEAIHGGYC